MVRLYSNEGFPLPVVTILRSAGLDILTVQEAGYANKGIDDSEVLEFARCKGRAVLTLNRKHFIRLHQQDSNHHGIIVCTQDLDFLRQARNIERTLCTERSLLKKLVRVTKG